MSVQEATFTPETALADPKIDAKQMLVLANVAAIPAFTPMKRDANKKLIPATSAADTIVGLTVPFHGSGYIEQLGLPIKVTDTLMGIYTYAKVYDGAINWAIITAANPTTINTNEKKQAAFDLTGVDVIFNTPGF